MLRFAMLGALSVSASLVAAAPNAVCLGRPCASPVPGTEICGSDGVTYASSCLFEDAQCRNPELTLAYNGTCIEPTKPVPTTTCVALPCPYGPIDIPVCASNGVTYYSACVFSYYQCLDPSLRIEHTGPCESTTPTPTTTKPIAVGALKWGQCGGINWTGPTTCTEGTCTKLNDWYFQCL